MQPCDLPWVSNLMKNILNALSHENHQDVNFLDVKGSDRVSRTPNLINPWACRGEGMIILSLKLCGNTLKSAQGFSQRESAPTSRRQLWRWRLVLALPQVLCVLLVTQSFWASDSFFFFYLFILYRSTANWQHSGSFRWTEGGLSRTYACIHSPQLPPHPGCHITLGRVSCAIQEALGGYLF